MSPRLKRNSLTLEELSATPVWRALSPKMKPVMTRCFTDSEFDLVAAISAVNKDASLDLVLDAAQRILTRNDDVRACIDLFIFGVDSFARRTVPPAPTEDQLL